MVERFKEIAEEFSKGQAMSIVKLQGILHANKCTLYSGEATDYNSIHFCRSIIAAVRQSVQLPRYSDDPREWLALASMGGGASAGSRYFGLVKPEHAANAVRKLSAAFNDSTYAFADLACFLCMLKPE